MHTDGGGKARAALKVLEGSRSVSRFLLTVVSPSITRPNEDNQLDLGTWFNGAPGALFSIEGKPASAFNFLIINGSIGSIHVQRNPDKLTAFTGHTFSA